ncbi:prephenate dehydrogenase (NADP(+)), partial [Podila minutissima]
MTLDVTQIRLDGDGGDGSRSPSPRPEGGLGGEERPPRRTPPPPDGGSGSGSKRRHESTEDEPEGGGRGGRPSDPKRPRPWSGEGSSRGGSGSHGSSTSGGLLDSSSSQAQPTPLAFSALVTPGGGGGGGREGESTPAAEAPPPPLSGLGMSTSTEVVPPSSICPLDLDTDLCMEIHYIDGYGRVLNMDGSTQEQMHTLFTFRQNRASGVAQWLHVLATRQLTEGYENLRVWEELVFPNPDDTSETETQTRTRRRGTLQLVEVNGRVARRQLPEGPSEGWPLNPYHVITLDPQGALANAQYKRDETIGGGNLRYSFEQRFNNEARRVVHVLLIPKGDDTQFEYQARDFVFGNRGNREQTLLSDYLLDQYSLGSVPKDMRKPNSHLSLLAIVDCWYQLKMNPYSHM